MLEISSKTNLLEKKSCKYSLQDVAEPNLHREVYSYGTIPKVAFNHRRVPMGMPEEIWITDTSTSTSCSASWAAPTASSARPNSLFIVRRTGRLWKSAWSWI